MEELEMISDAKVKPIYPFPREHKISKAFAKVVRITEDFYYLYSINAECWDGND